MKPKIVLSGVNFIEGGPLSVFQDALSAMAEHYADRFEIIALVHSRSLFSIENVTYLEFPAVKSSWLNRLLFEYRECRLLSDTMQPLLWLAMHDITPNVSARIRAVYCHNPVPFDPRSLKTYLRDPAGSAYGFLYQFLYRINLRKNDFVIVQQQWLRRKFSRWCAPRSIVVAHPHVGVLTLLPQSKTSETVRFFYPAFPRHFKNLEVILEAVAILEQRGIGGFEVALTIDGTENRYAAKMKARGECLRSIVWLGRLTRQQVLAEYSETDCLLFPSRLETWGLPISEFEQTGRPILVADLPYAHETVGTYDAVRFFPSSDGSMLASLMQALIQDELHLDRVAEPLPEAPFASDWQSLFKLLLG